MKIISYNVNGIRAALTKGLAEWLKVADPDVFCVQETKAMEEQVDLTEIEKLGYKGYWHSATIPRHKRRHCSRCLCRTQ